MSSRVGHTWHTSCHTSWYCQYSRAFAIAPFRHFDITPFRPCLHPGPAFQGGEASRGGAATLSWTVQLRIKEGETGTPVWDPVGPLCSLHASYQPPAEAL